MVDQFGILNLLHTFVDDEASEVARLTDQGKLSVFDLVDPKVYRRVTDAISEFINAVDDLEL